MNLRILSAALVAAILTLTATLHAQVPQIINYQGRVAVGTTNFDGSGAFKFALVDAGAPAAQATAVPIVAFNGVYYFVVGFAVTNPGLGYLAPSAVSVPGGAATGTTVVSQGRVVAINMTNPGNYGGAQPTTATIGPPTAGTYATSYWSNDGTSSLASEPGTAVSLPVAKGLYSVLLGDTSIPNMTAISAAVFNNPDVRLRVWFNDGSNGWQFLTPDQRIAAVGYAMVANTATTATTVPNGAITSAKLANGAVGTSQLANNAITAANMAVGSVGPAQLANGSVTASAVDSAVVQLRVTGTAPAGQFITGINANGTVSSAASSVGSGSVGGVPNGAQEFTTPGASTFTVPAGVTKILAEVWGAGGGAQAGIPLVAPDINGNITAQGWLPNISGTGGGYSRKTLIVVPGDVLNIVIGFGGTGGITGGALGNAGGSSSISTSANQLLLLSGGGSSGGAGGPPDPNSDIARIGKLAVSPVPAYFAAYTDPKGFNVIIGTMEPPRGTVNGFQVWLGAGGAGVNNGVGAGNSGGGGYILLQW